jgi:DNA-binding MarR family transcriptional regulator
MADAAPRWLDADEQRAWRLFLSAVQLLDTELDSQLQRDSGLSHADYEILVRLSESPGRQLRMSDLAARTLFSRSRLSHAVGRLEKEGWVVRRPCPDDRRGLLAVLTEAGFAKLEAAAPGHVEMVRSALLDPLSPDQVGQLGRIAQAVLEAAESRAASSNAEVRTATRRD